MNIIDVDGLNALILDSLSSGDSLQQIIDRMRQCSDIQCAVLDMSNRVLMHSIDECGSGAWKFAIEKGYLPFYLMTDDPKKRSRLEGIFKEGCPVLIEPSEGDRWFTICTPAYVGNRPESIVIARFPSLGMLDLSETASALLSQLCGYFDHSRSPSLSYNSDYVSVRIARELLLHNSDMARSLFGDAHGAYPGSSSYQLRPGYAVAVMRRMDKWGGPGELEEAERALSGFVPAALHLISDRYILAFMYDLGYDSFSGDCMLLAQLRHYTGKHRLYCGLSGIFEDLSQRQGFRRQAREALKLGMAANPRAHIFTADSMFADIIRSGAAERIGCDMLELSDVARLAQYDQANRTDYLWTLEQYLAYSNQLSLAAGSMFIDRNTMKYRLKKIREIIAADFSTPHVAMQLKQGIAMHRLMGRGT